jgi:hypothetical protein
MPVPKYSKCSCKNCGGHIEFPLSEAGRVATCPHCGLSMELTLDPDVLAELATGGGRYCPVCASTLSMDGTCPDCKAVRHRRNFLLLAVTISVMAVGLIYIAMNMAKKMNALKPQTPVPQTNTVSTKPVPVTPEPVVDLWNGLKPGPISIDKTGSSRLVYAVGTLRNETDHQRFGVKVDLELFNPQGQKIATATDTTQTIEPGKTWRFKAMVFDPKAVSAKLVNVTEK